MTFGRHVAAMLAARGLSVGASLLWIAVTARLYSAREIAFLAWLAIVAALIETAKGFGTGSLLVRRLPAMDGNPEGARRLKTAYFALSGALLFSVMAGALLLAPFAWKWGLAGVCLQALAGSWALTLQASSRFVESSLSQVLFAVASRALPAGAAWWFGLDLIQMLQATVAFSMVCVAAFGALFPFEIRGTHLGIGALSQLLRDAKHYLLAGWLRYGATQFDQTLAALLFPAELLAVYFVLRRLYSVGVLAIDSGIDVLIPHLAKTSSLDPSKARGQLLKVITMGLPAALAAVMLTAWACVPVTRWVFGAKFEQYSGLVVWLAGAAIAYAWYSLLLAGQLAFGEARRFSRLVGLATLINTGVAGLLSPLAGIFALPAAMCLGYSAAAWTASIHEAETRAAVRKLIVPAGLTAVAGAMVGFKLQSTGISGSVWLMLSVTFLTGLWLTTRHAGPIVGGRQ